MYYRLANKVGIFIDECFETKFGAMGMDVLAEKITADQFSLCISILSIHYTDKIDHQNCNEDGEYYYSRDRFIDPGLGVCIEKKSEMSFSIRANQECPEWFMCMLEIVLLKAKVTFVHCAAIEKNGKTLFLPARGGVGKTATVVKMIREHGWRLLCDDLLLLDGENCDVYSYHKKFVIYGYHKNLFPELFSERRSPIKSKTVNHAFGKMIPMVKKVLRTVPGLLAFARENNPMQMRVYPKEIFTPDQLAYHTEGISETIWLERTTATDITLKNCSVEEIASRCAAVTMSELTYGSMNLNNCLFTMCGSGMLQYSEIYTRIYQIVLDCVQGTAPRILGIPQDVPVEKVYQMVYETTTINGEF